MYLSRWQVTATLQDYKWIKAFPYAKEAWCCGDTSHHVLHTVSNTAQISWHGSNGSRYTGLYMYNIMCAYSTLSQTTLVSPDMVPTAVDLQVCTYILAHPKYQSYLLTWFQYKLIYRFVHVYILVYMIQIWRSDSSCLFWCACNYLLPLLLTEFMPLTICFAKSIN